MIDPIPSDIPGPHIFFDASKQRYWIKDGGGQWMPLSQESIVRRLRNIGLKSQIETGSTVSQVEVRLILIEDKMRIDYAGPVAGHKTGLHRFGEKRVLVTCEPRLIVPSRGKFPIHDTIVEQLYRDDNPSYRQALRYKLRLQRIYRSIAAGQPAPAQTNFLVGPANCAKSYTQHHIDTPTMGGRSGKPYDYLSGKTSHNGELIGCEHFLIEDRFTDNTAHRRKIIGANLKEWTTGGYHYFNPKYYPAINLPVGVWISFSLNDDADNLMAMPPFEESLYDKFNVFKCSHVTFPLPTNSLQQREELEKRMADERPAWIWHLLNEIECPPEWRCERFGVSSWQHPEIMQRLHEQSNDLRLLELIDQTMWLEKTDTKPWEGTAADLEHALLKSEYRDECKKLLQWNGAGAHYLGQLSVKYPERISYRRTRLSRQWRIESPFKVVDPTPERIGADQSH